MAVKPPDDGGGDPVSQYDYHDMTLQQLRDVLNLSSKDIKEVQSDWQALAGTLNSVLGDHAYSLQKALSFLTEWKSPLASQPFKERAQAIHDFGQLLADACQQAGEGFNDLSRTFHTSAWFLGLSIDDMNTVFHMAEQALQEWSGDLHVLIETLNGQGYGTSGYNDSSTIGGFAGYATWEGVPNRPEINFQYLYGHGPQGSYPGVVQFSGQVRPQYSRVDITAQAGPYRPTTVTNYMVGWIDSGWAAGQFSNTHRDQLAILLNQQAGGSYAPVVGKFPRLPPAPWLKDSGGGSTTTTGSPYNQGSYSGSAGTPPGGSAGLPGLGGTSGTAGSPTGTGTGLPGSGSIGSPSGSDGGAGGHSPLTVGSFGTGNPTQLAGYTPPSTGSGSLGSLPGGAGLNSAGFNSAGFNSAGLNSGSLGSAGGLGGGSGLGTGSGALGVAGETAAASGLAGAAGRSGMPMMPPMMPPQAGNQERDRQRKSWLPEDEDIWGTEADGVPPVISGDA